MSGKGSKSIDGDFIVSPLPARLVKSETGNTATLTCFAPSAQSYEWYEDGVLIPGETSDSLTLNWERAKAKSGKHTYT